MPKQAIEMSGEWQVIGLSPDGVQTKRLGGVVPGHVHVDLQNAGMIRDPLWRDQADECQWVEDWDWTYARDFIVPDDFDTDWAVLEFAGLDTFAEIRLNGETIGHTANMFIEHSFEVGERLRPGSNSLEVVFTSVAKAMAGKDVAKYPSCFSSDRVYARKMQCAFGWDWVNRFVSCGIWQPLRLHSYDGARTGAISVCTESIGAEAARIRVGFETEQRTDATVSAVVQIHDPAGSLVWEQRAEARPTTEMTVEVPNPQLWWPNGYGEQPLYVYSVRLVGDNDIVLDVKTAEFGIRTVGIEELEDNDGSSFTLCMNGERIFCKGGNWVPADPFPSRITDGHYDRLIRLARDGNINLLRAWGGGIYEPEAFWSACDRYGVMISQDFLMACAEYPEDDPEFLEQLREEFRQAIRMLRNHPSLVFWAGDNELGMNSNPRSQYPGKRIAEEVSGPLCRELDPSRPFRLTSPYGGDVNNSMTSGDCHVSAWYSPEFTRTDMVDYRERIADTIGRFVSEYAVPGAPPLRSLLKFMTKEDIADQAGAIWEYHTRDNPYNGVDDLTHFRMLELTAQNLFGSSDDIDIEAKVRKMGYAHYHWICLAVEAARRRKWYCSGIQFWMYNDCWPASGWSMVDYYGFPKASYYAAKRSFKPVICSIETRGGGCRVWVCSDSLQPVSGKLELKVQPWAGRPAWSMSSAFNVAANSSQVALEIPGSELRGSIGLDSILVCDLVSDVGADRAFHYRGMPHEMNLPPARLKVRRVDGDGSGELVISTDNYARVVTLDAELDFSDNYFDLLPGEETVITWTDPRGDARCPDVGVSCWNAS